MGSPADGTPEVAGLDAARGQPAGAVPVLCRPGSALVFDRRLLHAGTPNWRAHDRHLYIVGWAPRWLRPRDGLFVEPALAAARCPVRRQLLGEASSAAGLYIPTDGDTPLRRWLREHSGCGDGVGYEHRRHIRVSEPGAAQLLLPGEAGQASLPRHPGRAAAPPAKYLSRGMEKLAGAAGLTVWNPRWATASLPPHLPAARAAGS
jgi:hypothetical protein